MSNNQQTIRTGTGHDLSGDVYITHSEFVTNVTVPAQASAGASAFSISSYTINAAIKQTFPFLSQLAINFTLYELESCIFQFKPLSSDYGSSTSNSLGKVILCTNYDPDAPVFTTSQQMENYDYASSTKPSLGTLHGIECNPKSRATSQLYTRSGATSKDLVFTDVGLLQVATEGISVIGSTNPTVIGELWVAYKVKLSRKNLQVTLLDTPSLYYIGVFNNNTTTSWSSVNPGGTQSSIALSTLSTGVPDGTSIPVATITSAYQAGGFVYVPSLNTNTGQLAFAYYFPITKEDATYVFTLGYKRALGLSCDTFGTIVSSLSAYNVNCSIQTYNSKNFLLNSTQAVTGTSVTQQAMENFIITTTGGSGTTSVAYFSFTSAVSFAGSPAVPTGGDRVYIQIYQVNANVGNTQSS